MRTVIIDTETYRAAVEIEGGFENLSQFGLSLLVVGIPTSEEQIDYVAYSPYANLPHFPSFDFVDQRHIQILLDQADEIVSFNGDRFDFEVLYQAGFEVTDWRAKSKDILSRFYQHTGQWVSLQNLAYQQFGYGKTLCDGQQAVELWRAGLELLRGWSGNPKLDPTSSNHFCRQSATYLFQKVIDYTRRDIELTFKLHCHLKRHQRLTYFDTQLKQNQIVDFSDTSLTKKQLLIA